MADSAVADAKSASPPVPSNVVSTLLRASQHRLDHSDPAPAVKIMAPMVRYSKLPFRILGRRYGCDVAYTPMIIADPFNRSQYARDSEFATTIDDRPLVVQFAANDPIELANAALKTVGYVDAVGLNCGCPQKWALKEGIGASLIERPQLVKEMVRLTREKCPGLDVSVKIRLRTDIKATMDLVAQAEAVGVAWIDVHGRTVKQKRTTTPVDYDHLAQVVSLAKVPIVANGDVFSLNDYEDMAKRTKAAGVMCARGLLENPALFAGYDRTPFSCAQEYLDLAVAYGVGAFAVHQHHLLDMMGPQMSKPDRTLFQKLRSVAGICDFFEERGWKPTASAQPVATASVLHVDSPKGVSQNTGDHAT